MLISEFLTKAKALIDTPKKWTQGALSRDADGKNLRGVCGTPVCYCSLGAIDAVDSDDTDDLCRMAEIYLNRMMSMLDVRCDSIADFNDTHPHSDVMKAFDKAIEYSKAIEAL